MMDHEQSMVMLVIDESEVSCLLHELYFVEFGFRVDSTRDGDEALSKIRKCLPDVILISLSLTGAVDAWETIRRIKRDDVAPDARVIAMDSFVSLAERDDAARVTRAVAAGADAFVRKPCMPDTLLACIKELLGDSSSKPSQPHRLPSSCGPFKRRTLELIGRFNDD